MSLKNVAMVTPPADWSAVGIVKGQTFAGRQRLGKRLNATCQFIQHFRKQLFAGRVKNEEFLESERQVSES